MEPIRILHLLHGMNRGGAENAIMNYYRHIDRQLIQFDFLVTADEKCDFDDEILSMGGRIYKIPSLKLSQIFDYIKAVISFFQSHKEYKIIHSHTSSKSVIPLFIAKRLGVPVRLCHSHATEYGKGIRGLEQRILKPFLKKVSTQRCACGEKAAIWLYGRSAYKKGEILLLKNVIEARKHDYNPLIRKEFREKYDIEDDVLVIGHTARFNWIKNHAFDLHLLAYLKHKAIRAKLLWVGDGELRKVLEEQACQMDLLDDIIFTGLVNNVCDYEQMMDAFILPSFNEGLPVSVIEAQVSGLQCFVTDTIDKSCDLTGNVHYLSLEIGAEKWGDEILKYSSLERKSQMDIVTKEGYNAEVSALNLQNYYIQQFKKYATDK